MVFSSSDFLFAFLPATLLCYWLAGERWRNGIALAASLLFYAVGAPRFVYVLVGTCAIDWWISRRIVSATGGTRRAWLWGSLALNLSLLGWFKYAGFFVAQASSLLLAFGLDAVAPLQVALPIGISFFVFQKISYVVDVFRGAAPPAPTLGGYLLYVALFPQLIAGPIVRYHDIAQQLLARTHSAARFWHGVERFAIGLFKKAVLANGMAALCDPVYTAPIDTVTTAWAWVAVAAYYFQIWFDFSGYSDMAIGLGRMLGFEFLENFDRPYTARTFTEFWRRWHISLSNFMRDYLYVPLGGNRKGPTRTLINLWIVFLASGLWHGAAWHFVAWGAWQGVFLTLDRLFWSRLAERLPATLLRVGMVFLVMQSWVLFRSSDLTHAGQMWVRLFGGGPTGTTPLAASVPFDTGAMLSLLACALISFAPWSRRYCEQEQAALAFFRSDRGEPWARAATWIVLVIALVAVVGGQHNPFIYYQF
ncbi:MAG: MBOAT family protein [Planctomycetes bacterium]|nr:MBOAT family protein [Planctomycetota bacterium]